MLNGKNNPWNILASIANKRYNHVLISPKIALFKKFKDNILNSRFFIDHLFLLAIDKIYFVKESKKNFYLMYAKTKKI